MPKKPEKPRPSRRYTPPPSADYPLDRLKSASAVVAPPGLGGFPFTLASLFAKPGTDAQAAFLPGRHQEHSRRGELHVGGRRQPARTRRSSRRAAALVPGQSLTAASLSTSPVLFTAEPGEDAGPLSMQDIHFPPYHEWVPSNRPLDAGGGLQGIRDIHFPPSDPRDPRHPLSAIP